MESDKGHDKPLPSKNIQFLFYQPDQPEQPFSQPNRQPTAPRWERLADRIGLAAGDPGRLDAQSLLTTFPRCDSDTAIQAALRLASSTSPNQENQEIRAIILISLCTVLDTSGSVDPEDLDGIIQTIIQSSKPRYLDRIKRGARVANEIIAAWAERYTTGNALLKLEQATQAVLQGIHFLLLL